MSHRKAIFLIGFLSCLSGLSFPGQAALERTLNEKTVIEAHISQDNLTRIKVEGDRILHVFGLHGTYALEAEEETGQIFIRPLESFEDSPSQKSKPIHLTLTTEKGLTQDLRLVPKNKSPEALILKSPEPKDLKKERNLISQQQLKDLIQACQDNRIPQGYRSVPLKIDPPHLYPDPLTGPFEVQLIREVKEGEGSLQGSDLKGGGLQGRDLKGLTYEIKNTSSNALVLCEQELALRGPIPADYIIAILFSKRTLHPGESTHAYIIAKVL